MKRRLHEPLGGGAQRRGGTYLWRRRLPAPMVRATGRTTLSRSIPGANAADVRDLAAEVNRVADVLFAAAVLEVEAGVEGSDALAQVESELDRALSQLHRAQLERAAEAVGVWRRPLPKRCEARGAELHWRWKNR